VTTTERIAALLPTGGDLDEMLENAALADFYGYEAINVSHIAARDSFSCIARLSGLVQHAILGTAVAPIYHRSPASMAQAAATLADMTGGRFRLGLGTGHQVTMGGWHGQTIGKPVAEMREYVSVVRAVLDGTTPFEGSRWSSTFAFMGWEPTDEVPIHLAALSPGMLKLAGEIADGVLLWACPSSYVRDVVVPAVAEGRASAGKTLDGFSIAAAVPTSLDDEGGAAHAGIRAELHRYFSLPYYRRMFDRAGYGKDIAEYDSAADTDAQLAAISDEFLADLCAIGDEMALATSIERYRDAGANLPMITHVRGTVFDKAIAAAAPPAH